MLLEIEAEIIEKLKTQFTTLSVESYPDNPSTYKLLNANGALLVRYGGETATESSIQQVLTQDERSIWNVVVVTRGLRTHTGAYPVIDQVKENLGGETIQGGIFRPAGVSFLSESGGVWFHVVAFELKQRAKYK